MTVALATRALSCGYGQSVVVRDLTISVDAGELVALLGANGAGKTTTLLTLAGVLRPVGGEVTVLGQRVAGWSAAKLANNGVVMVPDDRGLFPKLTVRENLAVARPRRQRGGDPLELFPELHSRLSTPSGLLSGGQQQMLAIARALLRSPKLLLVDELSLGLAPLVVARLLPILRQLVDTTGCGVLLVEQHVHLALAVADRAYVISHGSLTLEGPAAHLRNNVELLHDSYLGEVSSTDSN